MEAAKFAIDHTWDDLPLQCVKDFLDPLETLCFTETCSNSRAAAKEVHGCEVPLMKTKYTEELVADMWLERVKWVRAQKPPCPCNFWSCLGLSKKDGLCRSTSSWE